MVTKPMTKTEVRRWMARIRDDLAWAECALRDNDGAELLAAMMDVGGAAGQVESAMYENEWDGDQYRARGIRGMTEGT